MRQSTIRLYSFVFACLALAGMLAAPGTAYAQERSPTSVQVEHFEPLPSQGINILNMGTSDVLPHLQPSAGLFLHYVDDPLQLVTDDGVQARLIDSQLKGELLLGIGAFEFFDLGLALPVIFYQTGDRLGSIGQPDVSIDNFSVADARITPKFRIIHREWAGGFGLAAMAHIFAPLGNAENFSSDGAWRVEPRLVADWSHDEMPITVSANFGYQFRPQTISRNIVTDDVFRYGLGLELPTGLEDLTVIGSFFGSVSTQQNRDIENPAQTVQDSRNEPMEVLGGLQYALPYQFVAQLGGGAGVSNGVGAPDFRIFGSIGYTPRATDTDDDGIVDAEDACPRQPEDIDGFEDGDGCPETEDADPDNDGLINRDDECPNRPEDPDGFEDDDGCPDNDNDGDDIKDSADDCPDVPGVAARNGCPLNDSDNDGVEDNFDECPERPEDPDGFEDEDGCPDTDNDEDGIPDKDDDCPNEKEDMDGYADKDGCPDTDNDGDGIKDSEDKCPDEREVINGNEDDDGCPDKGKPKVRVTQTKVEILDKVYFETDKAKIQERSYNLLDQVASILKANPQITKLRVEGHTDYRGKADYNLDLSGRRALAVRNYLVETGGIDKSRITYKGYGETSPIESSCEKKSGKSKRSCMSKNRRVEFTIIEVEGEPVGEEGAVIEKEETIEYDEDGEEKK